MSIPFIKYSKFLLAISGLVTVISLISLFVWGLKPGIDFTGGSLLEISFSQTRPDNQLIEKAFVELGHKNVVIQKTGEKGAIIRTAFLPENEHQVVLKGLRTQFEKDGNVLHEDQFQTIGAAVSKQLRTRSVWAVFLVIISFSEMIDIGLNETLMRSINTTLITMIPLSALYFFGGATIKNFALALLVGIASGAYSSIFVASPLLAYVDKWQKTHPKK